MTNLKSIRVPESTWRKVREMAYRKEITIAQAVTNAFKDSGCQEEKPGESSKNDDRNSQ